MWLLRADTEQRSPGTCSLPVTVTGGDRVDPRGAPDGPAISPEKRNWIWPNAKEVAGTEGDEELVQQIHLDKVEASWIRIQLVLDCFWM